MKHEQALLISLTINSAPHITAVAVSSFQSLWQCRLCDATELHVSPPSSALLTVDLSLQYLYLPSATVLKRWAGDTASTLFVHVDESLQGMDVIRAFAAVDYFIQVTRMLCLMFSGMLTALHNTLHIHRPWLIMLILLCYTGRTAVCVAAFLALSVAGECQPAQCAPSCPLQHGADPSMAGILV
jgi:hypothetical protein